MKRKRTTASSLTCRAALAVFFVSWSLLGVKPGAADGLEPCFEEPSTLSDASLEPVGEQEAKLKNLVLKTMTEYSLYLRQRGHWASVARYAVDCTTPGTSFAVCERAYLQFRRDHRESIRVLEEAEEFAAFSAAIEDLSNRLDATEALTVRNNKAY